MQIHLSPNDGVPIYRQIVNQVKYLVAAGRLVPGEEIPPIRSLAAQLVINPNTVARAYLDLERDGIVIKRHGSGTFIADGGSPLKTAARQEILAARVDALLAEARHLGVPLAELHSILEQRSKILP